MKASELMLGDLLTFKDCLKDGVFTSIKVCELHDYNKDILVSIDGDTSCDLIELDDEIVPIPLTPEILEKNGFEKDQESGEMIWCDEDVTEVVWCGTILNVRGEYANCECATIMYIHQLQHALRLCGIEKEIVL